jgi:hypothetical protein
MAARILQAFPGYTLDSLLDEPLHVFYALNDAVSRTRADHALDMQVPAIQAAMNGGDAYKLLEKRRGEFTIVDHSKENYTQSEYLAALEKAKAIAENKNKVVKSIKLRDFNV